MPYTGIVLISHSPKVVEGVREIIRQVITEVPIEIAGGTEDDAIGTNVEKIQLAIERADQGQGVLLLYDIGSAKMNAELAVEMDDTTHAKILEAPLVEGAYLAAVESGMGRSFQEVIAAVTKEFG
ncbi:PTS-dependent dihydroxyacetone kinase phosphotransferase subunit DhaM [Lentibacillus cibarius]|uniref:phosphoenolpyruvate--glycerone phosphotransferase n=1 Tax=Lentibacillus cibarius TaxID=2583219 RepID=A0A549YMJ8_9BACI|nr:dihydroxyacetone kinase phosphoryl donor subunit DhaM [Lentibacillus cibarius]TRM13113.1 PTS-dependent dihydroxyacetone kinase phosphotransferase subunit DhaM [Lentibacillus cibarius]